MPPKGKGKGKKGKKGKKGAAKQKEVELEVDKSFYEDQITELNHELSDLRTKQIEVQDRYEELTQEHDSLIEDEADIIAYLNRTIQNCTDNLNSIQKECEDVEEQRAKDAREFEEKMVSKQEHSAQDEEQLQAELKLTFGMMHALEEFRLMRDDLMAKYEQLEVAVDEQRERHKNEVYEVEKMFIIGEDKLKKDIDAKLMWLFESFQAVTNVRIAAMTQRIIKENIALNNTLEQMLAKLRKLYMMNIALENRYDKMEMMADLTLREAAFVDMNIEQQQTQIRDIVGGYIKTYRQFDSLKRLQPRLEFMQQRKQMRIAKLAEYEERSRILQQHLHEQRCHREDVVATIRHERATTEELKDMLRNVADMLDAISENADVYSAYSLPAEDYPVVPSVSTTLYKIYDFLESIIEWYSHPKPIEMLEDRNDVYMQGRLGLVPRKVMLPSMIPIMADKAEQVDGSYDLLPSSESSWIGLEEIEEEEPEEVEVEAASIEQSVESEGAIEEGGEGEEKE